MKILTSLLCLLLLLSCSTEKNYEIENQQYNCLKEKYQANGNANLDELMLAIENELIKQDFLKDHSSAGFFKCIQLIAEEDEKPLSISSKLSRSILKGQGYGLKCTKTIVDLDKLNKSRLTEVMTGVQSIFEEMTRDEGGINTKRMADDLVKVFKQEDFDHPFYRLSAFYVITFLAEFEYQNQNRGVLGRTNKMMTTPMSEKSQMNILINKQNQILIDEVEVSFDAFSKKVDQLFTKSRTESKQSKRIKDRGDYPVGRAFISFGNEKETDYDFYLKVFKQLESSYAKVLNELAIEVFKQPFDQLNKEQQKNIKDLQPWMVSESEPVGD